MGPAIPLGSGKKGVGVAKVIDSKELFIEQRVDLLEQQVQILSVMLSNLQSSLPEDPAYPLEESNPSSIEQSRNKGEDGIDNVWEQHYENPLDDGLGEK
jgi:hypothetical protein